MKPATTYPARRDDVRLLVIDPLAPGGRGAARDAHPCPARLPRAPAICWSSTTPPRCPASLRGHDDAGDAIEARLVAARGDDRFAPCCSAPATGAQRTEDRPPPPALPIGARLRFGALAAEIVGARRRLSPRLVELRFDADGRRAVGGALPRGAAGPVRVPRARSAAVGGADRLRRAPVGVRDAVGRAAAVVGDPARAAPQGRALGVAHARRRA